MINVAMIGTGNLGSRHAANFAQIDGCQVKRVYDIVSDTATACAAQVGAEVAGSPEECFAADVDAVVIATPTDVHAQCSLQAAQAGKHIFSEKPMTRTLEEADQVVAAVRGAGVKMMVGHVVRFCPEYARARQMIQDGALGKLGMIRMARINSMNVTRPWFTQFERSGGVILDMILHDFDWLLWTLGKPEQIYAKSLHKWMPVLDYALCTFRFPGGAIAHVEGSWADTGSFRTNFEIAGSGGLLAHDSTQNVTLTVQQRQQDTGAAPARVPAALAYKSPYLVEDELFIQAIENDSAPPVSAEDGRESVRLALATLESAQTGQVVSYSSPIAPCGA